MFLVHEVPVGNFSDPFLDCHPSTKPVKYLSTFLDCLGSTKTEVSHVGHKRRILNECAGGDSVPSNLTSWWTIRAPCTGDVGWPWCLLGFWGIWSQQGPQHWESCCCLRPALIIITYNPNEILRILWDGIISHWTSSLDFPQIQHWSPWVTIVGLGASTWWPTLGVVVAGAGRLYLSILKKDNWQKT